MIKKIVFLGTVLFVCFSGCLPPQHFYLKNNRFEKILVKYAPIGGLVSVNKEGSTKISEDDYVALEKNQEVVLWNPDLPR